MYSGLYTARESRDSQLLAVTHVLHSRSTSHGSLLLNRSQETMCHKPVTYQPPCLWRTCENGVLVRLAHWPPLSKLLPENFVARPRIALSLIQMVEKGC